MYSLMQKRQKKEVGKKRKLTFIYICQCTSDPNSVPNSLPHLVLLFLLFILQSNLLLSLYLLFFFFLSVFLADPSEARGCSKNSLGINSLIHSFIQGRILPIGGASAVEGLRSTGLPRLV